MKWDCVVIVGATGTGKSSLAMALSEHLPMEIVNGDSQQIYRGLEIGTAKPSLEDRLRVPHHLFDFAEPRKAYSAGEFAGVARDVMQEVRDRSVVPVLVGGSGLYLSAVIDGLSPMPEIDPEVRKSLRERLAMEGSEALHRQLEACDPTLALRLHKTDPQRILRGLEVLESSGVALSEWQKMPPKEPSLKACWIGLTLDRTVLYDRIASRAKAMLEAGWLEEIRSLLAAGVSVSSPAFQAIGYREFTAYLQGERSLDDALEATIRSTRRYAKRQLTWFRRRDEIHWLDADDKDGLIGSATHILEEQGLLLQS